MKFGSFREMMEFVNSKAIEAYNNMADIFENCDLSEVTVRQVFDLSDELAKVVDDAVQAFIDEFKEKSVTIRDFYIEMRNYVMPKIRETIDEKTLKKYERNIRAYITYLSTELYYYGKGFHEGYERALIVVGNKFFDTLAGKNLNKDGE